MNKLNLNKFNYRVLPEYLYMFKYGIYFTKNSPFVGAFNKKISLFKSAGLIEFWVSKYLDSSYLRMKMPKKEPSRLNIEQLGGGFRLWVYGCLVSFVTFLLENIYIRFIMCKQNNFKSREKNLSSMLQPDAILFPYTN